MARVTIAELEKQIGHEPFVSYKQDDLELDIRSSPSFRLLLNEWLIKQGIPHKAATSALTASVVSAYCRRGYLNTWRNRINPSWSLLGGDEDAELPLPSPTNYTTGPMPSAPTAVQPVANPNTEIWLKGLFGQVEKAVHSLIDVRLRDAKIDLSDKAKQEIIALARSSVLDASDRLRQEALALLEERLPPRQIEIKPAASAEIIPLGLQHEKFPILLQAMQAKDNRGFGLNIWLTGPTGSGKTSAVQSAAKALSLEFEAESSLDADYKITGFANAQGQYMPTAFFRRYTEGGVILLDEIDNYSPSALLAVNSACANGFAQFPHGHFERHKDCIIIACANTWGLGATGDYVGRTRLDAASLDRFQPKINWPYDEKLERAVADAAAGPIGLQWFDIVRSARAKAVAQGLKIIISPRATYNGISLLKQGFALTDVVDMTLAAGISAEQKRAIGLFDIQPPTAKAAAPTTQYFIDDRIRNIAQRGQHIAAIKMYRETHGCDFYAAKVAIDQMLSAQANASNQETVF